MRSPSSAPTAARALAAAGLLAVLAAPAPPSPPPAGASPARAGRGGVYFEVNRGQAGARARFVARGGGAPAWLDAGGGLTVPAGGDGAIRLRPTGGRAAPALEPESPLPARVTYFRGRGAPIAGVRTYRSVRYRSVYPGIDLVYHGRRGRLEYDFEVAPGADASRIRLSADGAGRPGALWACVAAATAEGGLRLESAGGGLLQHRPVAYQEEPGGRRRPVPAVYRLERTPGGEVRVAFALGAYDRRRALVIDPELSFSTYAGGGGSDEALAVAVDRQGRTYAAGRTASVDFPTAPPGGSNPRGGDSDAFVLRLSRTGELEYAAYLGGSGTDRAAGLAVSAEGEAVVTGSTDSLDFPVRRAAQSLPGGNGDAFVARLNRAGTALLHSSYLGGADVDRGDSAALEARGAVVVAGTTRSPDFPTTAGAPQRAPAGGQDLFAATLAANGRLLFATYLGGSEDESPGGAARVAVTPAGLLCVAGSTRSRDYPITGGAAQRAFGGGDTDACVTLMDAHRLRHSTYLGGSDRETIAGLVVDAAGRPLVAGTTGSPDLPTTAGGPQPDYGGGSSDAFYARWDPAARRLDLCSFLGGRGEEGGLGAGFSDAGGLARDREGRLFLTGATDSADFPSVSPLQNGLAGETDAYLAIVDLELPRLLVSGPLGGRAADAGAGIAVDDTGSVHLAGRTASLDFPVRDAFQPAPRGAGDAFVLRVAGAALLGPRLEVNPAAVVFAPLRVNRSRARDVRLSNPGSEPVTGSVGALEPPFNVFQGAGAFVLAPGEVRAVRIQFAPVLPGGFRSTLVITSTDPRRARAEIPVRGSGR